jgi:hypothetical protein
MGGLHSGETGPSEMLMELAYRLVTETSPLVSQIREQLYVSMTPAADADGRDRNVDWFFRGLDMAAAIPAPAITPAMAPTPVVPGDTTRRAPAAAPGGGGGFGGGAGVPYWGKYVYHDNNRDINIKLVQMRAIIEWYFTAHPPIMHDLHEAQPLLYTYTGGPPQNPNLDPILFAELPWFGNWEMAQMTKWGMPGVYTHAFMDGWSPGYLGSVAYNHNGLMKMYETQSGRDLDSTAMANARRGAASAAFEHQLHADRRVVGAAAGLDVPGHGARELLHQDAQQHRGGQGQGAVRLRDSVAARHDARGGVREPAARAAHRSGTGYRAGEGGRGHVSRRLICHQA